MALFGIDNLEELKERIKRCKQEKEMHYNGNFDFAPSILNYIKIDDIGIRN